MNVKEKILLETKHSFALSQEAAGPAVVEEARARAIAFLKKQSAEQ